MNRDHPYTTYAWREGGRVETKAYEPVQGGREGKTSMRTRSRTRHKKMSIIVFPFSYTRAMKTTLKKLSADFLQ